MASILGITYIGYSFPSSEKDLTAMVEPYSRQHPEEQKVGPSFNESNVN